MRFESGFVYIIKAMNGYWYIVRQTGDKSWDALEFATLHVHRDDVYRHSNGAKLWAQLKPRDFKKILDVPSETKEFRKALFTVLQYGIFNA